MLFTTFKKADTLTLAPIKLLGSPDPSLPSVFVLKILSFQSYSPHPKLSCVSILVCRFEFFSKTFTAVIKAQTRTSYNLGLGSY